MIEEVTVGIESVHSQDAMMLIEQLSQELAARYEEDEEEGAGAFAPTDVDVAGAAFVVARWHGQAVGCGALRPFDEGRAEIKRMFVQLHFRGRGVSKLILTALEEAARGFGYRAVVLEIGVRQPEAIGLYERAGFTRIPCYGRYVNNPWSVCFEKKLW